MTHRILRETQWWQDTYTGTAIALIAQGIIEPWHLLPQTGRQKGRTMFMPDGQAAPAGVSLSKVKTAGGMRITQLSGGLVRVEVTVSEQEQARRRADADAVVIRADQGTQYRGTMEQLLRVGIPAHWLEGLPRPGKRRGSRSFYSPAENRQVHVKVAEDSQFAVEVKAPIEAEQPRLHLVWRRT